MPTHNRNLGEKGKFFTQDNSVGRIGRDHVMCCFVRVVAVAMVSIRERSGFEVSISFLLDLLVGSWFETNARDDS